MTTRVINFDDDVASQATPSSTTFTFDSNEIVTAEDSKDLMVGGESGDAFQFELDTYKGFTNTRPVAVAASSDDTVTCTVTGGIINSTTTWRPSDVDGVLFFNEDNTGFVWVVGKEELAINFMCDGNTIGPFSPTGGGVLEGDISLTAITLDSTNILSSITQSYDSGTELLTITYSTQIPFSDMNADQTSAIAGTFTIGTTEDLTQSTSILYEAPEFFNSISRANVDFNETYTTANVFHTFNRGDATSVTSSTFGGTATGIGVASASITFTALNRQSNAASRLLTEVMRFQNATNSSNTRDITSSATLSPTFFFPVYLGNVTTAESAALTATLLNTTSRFSRFGTFTSTPANQEYSFADSGVAAQTERIFAVRSSFTNGADITVRPMDGGFPSIVSRNSQLALGTISGNTENYDVYIVQSGSPGAGTLFIEV